VASYDAVVNLNVVGTNRLERVNAAVGQLNDLTRQLNSNFNLLAPGGGKLGDKLRQAFEPISNFAREASNGTAKLANTLAGAAAQAQVFATVLDNVKIQAGGLSAQEARVKNLSAAWLETTLNAQRYQKIQDELKASQLAAKGLMQLSSGEIVRGTEAGVGIQGPRLPQALGGGMGLPQGVSLLAAPGLRGLQGAVSKPGIADAIIGGGFPALFGGGPGAMIGGAVGGFAGGAMGGPLGMALSIGLSAVGQKFDQIFGNAIQKTSELGTALNRLDIQVLRDSTVVVTAELETQVRLLREAGKYDQARAVIAKELAAQTGATGTSIQDSAAATNRLTSAWQSTQSIFSTLLASLTVDFQNGLAAALQLINLIFKGINVVVSGARALGDIINKYAPPLNIVGAILQRIAALLPKNTEEQAKLNAAVEAELDAGYRNIKLKNDLLGVERQRLDGTNRIARASQIEADYKSKALQIQSDLQEKIYKINLNGANLAPELVQAQRDQAAAAAAQDLAEAAITKEKAQQKLLIQEQTAALQMAADSRKAELQAIQILLSGEVQRHQIGIERLQQQQEFALSLNEEAGIIGRIAEMRKQQAQAEYQASVVAAQAAVELAASELTIVETRYRRNEADIEQLNTARLNLQTTQLQAGVDTQIAGLKFEQANRTIQIQAAQQQLNAYVQEYERSHTRVKLQLDEQLNALNNQARLTSALSQAVQTVNNIEIQALERELERTTSVSRRKEIIQRIYDLEVQNAKVVFEATKAQIELEIAREVIAFRRVELQVKLTQATLEEARAKGIVNRSHYDAVNAARSALSIASDNLSVARQIGQAQLQAAGAVYNAAVNAAKLRSETLAAQGAANAYANSMERAANAWRVLSKETDPSKPGYFARKGPIGEIGTQTIRTFTPKSPPSFAAMATGGYVNKPTTALIGEGGEGEYVVPESKAASFAKNYLLGARGSAAIPQFAEGGYVGPINITTGPVLQQNGERYVTMGDLEGAMQTVISTILNNGRTNGGRQYTGIR